MGSSLWFSQLRLIFLLLTAFIIGFGLIVTVTEARFSELNASLGDRESKNLKYRTFSLIAKYIQIRDRAGHEEAEAYTAEAKLAMTDFASIHNAAGASLRLQIGHGILNGVGYLLNGKAVKTGVKTQRERTLDKAFHFEMRKLYAEAIAVYEELLADGNEHDEDYHFAKLHKGFCESLADRRSEAIRTLQEVLSSAAPEEYRFTAEALISLISTLESRLAKISVLPDSELKAEKYYQIAAYMQAISVYERAKERGLSDRGLFFLARSYEETGAIEKAAAQYRRIVDDGTSRRTSLAANRRLYLLGTVFSTNKNYADIAEANAQGRIPDAAFIREISVFAPALRGYEQKADSSGMAGSAKPAPESDRQKISRTERKIAAMQPEKKKEIFRSVKKVERVRTTDGNQFVGSVISENRERLIMVTVLGKIEVDSRAILQREILVDNAVEK